jgi:hypothetical protein
MRKERLELDRGSGALGDVVGEHGQVGGVSDRVEVPDEPFLGWPVVVGADGHDAVSTGIGGRTGGNNRMRRVVGTDPRDDRGAVADRVEDRSEDGDVLLVGLRR